MSETSFSDDRGLFRQTKEKVTMKEWGFELPRDHFRIFVNYSPLPSRAILRKTFLGGVSRVFDGRPFFKTVKDRDYERPANMCIMLVQGFELNVITTDQVLNWGKTQKNAVAPFGYRPATEKEAYAFAISSKTKDLFRGLEVIALGSHATSWEFIDEDDFSIPRDGKRVATIHYCLNGELILGDCGLDCGNWKKRKFLFVSREKPD